MDPLRQDLLVAWNRQLYIWWEYYNGLYLARQLKKPVIEISEGRSAFGKWDKDKRRILVSREHIEKDPWLDVMETLRHEMAHQYVDDVLRPHDEPAHGGSFGEASERLRCLPRHRRRTQDTEGEARFCGQERILRILNKLLSLADSPNENEAQAAVQKARQLMMQYNIDQVQLDTERRFQSRTLGEVKGRRTSSELRMASILNRFFFVEVLWQSSYLAKENKRGSVLCVYGTPENLDMAEYVFHYLGEVLSLLWEEYKRKLKLSGNRARQRFYAGVLDGFYKKLESQEMTLARTQALIWKGDPRLRAYYEKLNPRVRTYRTQGVHRDSAYADGVSHGKQVHLRRPLREGSKGISGYLT